MYLVYFITDTCNAKCKHCLLADGAHPGWEKPSMAFRKQELTLEEIDKVTASLGKGSLMFLLPTGGEPFLRKDIGEIVKIFHKNTGVPERRHPDERQHDGAHRLDRRRTCCECCPELDLAHRRVARRRRRAATTRSASSPGLFERSIADVQGAPRGREALQELQRPGRDDGLEHNEDKLVENYEWFRENLDVDTVFTLLTRGKPEGAAREVLRRREVRGVRQANGAGLQERLAQGATTRSRSPTSSTRSGSSATS